MLFTVVTQRPEFKICVLKFACLPNWCIWACLDHWPFDWLTGVWYRNNHKTYLNSDVMIIEIAILKSNWIKIAILHSSKTIRFLLARARQTMSQCSGTQDLSSDACLVTVTAAQLQWERGREVVASCVRLSCRCRPSVQALSSDAQHPHWPGSSVLGRLCVSNHVVIESSALSVLISHCQIR